MTGYQRAKDILNSNREALARIANALLERESLDNSEVRMLMEGKQLPARVIPPPTAAAPETTQVLKPQPGPGSVPGRERPQPA